MTETPEIKPKPLFGRIVRGGLYALLAGAGVFAAWQAHLAWVAPDASPPPRPRTFALPRPATQDATSQPMNPMDPMGDMVSRDVQKIQGELRDLPAPPPGSGTQSAWVLHQGAGVVASWQWPGTPAAAGEYYRKALAEAQWRLVKESADGRGTYMTFTGHRKSLVVSLRPDARDANRVNITATVTPN